jgi:carboxyl-terminal processing protease
MKRLLGCFVLLFSLFLATGFYSPPVHAQTQVQSQATQRFDGKLLYQDAFEHVRDNHLALLTQSARDKWVKTWQHRYSDKWLRTPGNADIAIVRMLESLKHKHDNYFTLSQWQTQVDESHGLLVGIGAIFEVKNKTTGGGMTNRYTLSVERQLVVAEDPTLGSPAANAGLQKGDIVLFVQGNPVRGQVAQDVIDTINGSVKGSRVRLTIKRQDAVKQLRLTRDLIITPTVKFLEVNSSTAYIKQLDFNSDLVESEMRAALTKASKYKTLILDLRGNLGGRLEAALSVFAQTHESGTALVMRERMIDKLVETTYKFTPTEFHTIVSENGVVTETNIVARADESLLALNPSTKIFLLIDDESASASEIFAGAYKVSNRGVIIGIKSYGKDVGQSVFGIKFGRGISITSFEFLPGGVSMNRQGIDPHIVVMQRGNSDKQFERAMEEAIKP